MTLEDAASENASMSLVEPCRGASDAGQASHHHREGFGWRQRWRRRPRRRWQRPPRRRRQRPPRRRRWRTPISDRYRCWVLSADASFFVPLPLHSCELSVWQWRMVRVRVPCLFPIHRSTHTSRQTRSLIHPPAPALVFHGSSSDGTCLTKGQSAGTASVQRRCFSSGKVSLLAQSPPRIVH